MSKSTKKIIISNLEFDYDFGCRVLKLKYDKAPFPELEDFWEEIKPAKFSDIAKLKNIEQRRVAIFHLGLEKLVKEVQPILIDKKTINKKTTYINDKGELVFKEFKDTYELYRIDGAKLNTNSDDWRRFRDAYYVKCKDTSTDREYFIFVDNNEILRTNFNTFEKRKEENLNAIQAIAWTIQTDIREGDIEKIVRQGDCILLKPKPENYTKGTLRHLTEKEYRQLLVAES